MLRQNTSKFQILQQQRAKPERMDYIMTILTAKDGYTYTNGTIYAKEVCLSNLDSPSEWVEITDKEAEEKQQAETSTDYFEMLQTINSTLTEQKEALDTLTSCVLEMSEIVYA